MTILGENLVFWKLPVVLRWEVVNRGTEKGRSMALFRR